MKFVIGYPESSDDFQPEADGWRRLPEPEGHADIVKLGLPFSIILGLFFYWANVALADFSFDQLFDEFDLWVFLIMGVLVVVHEGVHAMMHPDFGLSEQTSIGYLPKAGLVFYAYFNGPTNRNRALAIALAPFICLSIFPLAIAALYVPVSSLASFIAIANASFSALDIVKVGRILRKIPCGSLLRGNGELTYWKL